MRKYVKCGTTWNAQKFGKEAKFFKGWFLSGLRKLRHVVDETTDEEFQFLNNRIQNVICLYSLKAQDLSYSSKMAWKKNAVKKTYKNHLGGNNYEVCKAVARCIPNILDVMVLENIIKVFKSKHGDHHGGLI